MGYDGTILILQSPHGDQRFINMFINRIIGFCSEPVVFVPRLHTPISLRSILILSSYLCLHCPSSLFN